MRIRALLCLAVLATLLPLSQATATVSAPKPRLDAATYRLVRAGAPKVDVVIQYRTPPTVADGQALLAAGFLAGSLVRYQVVPAISATGSATAIKALASNPRISLIEHDAVIPWSLDRATRAGRARQIWEAPYKLNGEDKTGGFTGRGIGIAIVDSGIDATNLDLIWKPLADAQGAEPKTIANFKIVGRDSAGLTQTEPPSGDPFPEVPPTVGPFLEANQLTVDVPHSDNTGGHGTHVAGIAAGNGASSDGRFKGAAPGANLIGYGAGETLVITMGLAALDHIHLHHAELGIRVVNNSWGGAGEWNPDAAITKAVQRLVNEDGIAVVFAAGNSGGNGSDIQSSIWGNIPEVIQVANYYDRTGWLDDTSSRGRRDREDTWPDLAAPGTQVISTAATGGPVTVYGSAQDAVIDELLGPQEPTVVPAPLPVTVGDDQVLVGNYASFTGTSMAAPFVTGVVALILEANPELDPFQVRDILRATANMPPGRTYNGDGFAIGRGVVDAAESVAVALRMREGRTLEEALGAAHVDTSDPERYTLNMRDGRTLEITSPAEGDDAHTTLEVEGNVATTSADDAIPLHPDPTGAPGAPTAPPFKTSAAQGSLLTEGFEDPVPVGWTTEQNSPDGPGLLTEWRRMTDDTMTWAGANSGKAWFGANMPTAQAAETYSDSADVSLVSPVFDLAGLSTATAKYFRGGASENNADFFEAYVDPEGPAEPVLLERLSGDFILQTTATWAESPVFNLSAFIGQQVRLRFRFTSNEQSLLPNYPGWRVDDVEVSGASGSPEATLEVSGDFGVAPFATMFGFGYSGTAASYDLDFGDGTSNTSAEPGQIGHTYDAGTYSPVLTVRDGSGNVLDTDEVTIEAAPERTVQLRLVHGGGSTAWVDVSATDGPFAHSFDLSSIPVGPAAVEARHFVGERVLRDTVRFDVVEPVVTPTGPVANDDTASATSSKSETIDVLANDDLGDATVTVSSAAQSAQGGSVTVQKDGSVRYRSAPRFSGTDTFTYTITDTEGNTDQATVTVTVSCRLAVCA